MPAVWRSFPDPAAAAAACARHIADLLDVALASQDSASLALSGGTTARGLFESLALLGVQWSRVHLFWTDERAVPPDHALSNYRLAAERLILPARIPSANVHRIHGELAPQAAAKAYAGDIRRHFGLGPGELPAFDVLHLGIGADGHIASLFPDESLLEDRSAIAAAVFARKLEQWRITLLPGVLLAARQAVFLASGADKAQAVRAVIEEPFNPLARPAQLLRGRPAMWFLDEAAASLLGDHGRPA